MTQVNEAQALISNAFDIGSLDSIASARFEVAVITDKDGNPKSGFVIVGKNSDEYKAAAHKIRIEAFMRNAKRKEALDTGTVDGAETLAEGIEANDITLAYSVVVDWFGFAENGKVLEFNTELAKKMMVKLPTWRQAVLDALEKDANFMKG